jgi:hypothetical protein
MKRLMLVLVGVFIAVMILVRVPPEEEVAPTPTSITFLRPLQILMPGDLCDNYQSTLQYWVNVVLATPYEHRHLYFAKVAETREDMRNAGCG